MLETTIPDNFRIYPILPFLYFFWLLCSFLILFLKILINWRLTIQHKLEYNFFKAHLFGGCKQPIAIFHFQLLLHHLNLQSCIGPIRAKYISWQWSQALNPLKCSIWSSIEELWFVSNVCLYKISLNSGFVW
jgi:hypothetical protein